MPMTPETMTLPAAAQLCEGIALPASEEHFVDMISKRSKVGSVTLLDGRTVGTYQKHKLDLAMSFIPADRRRVCIDVGGHVGLWSQHLAELFDQVHAFEPVPLHRDCFRYNVRTDNVTLHEAALGAWQATVKITVPGDNTGHAHIRGGDWGPAGESDRTRTVVDNVELAILDHFGFENVDLIKIDVEGTELAVCQGAAETIKRCRPVMVVEQKGNDAGVYGQKQNGALDFLFNLGASVLDKYSGDWILGFKP